MRARYSAFATGDVGFLHDSCCGPARKEFRRESVQQWVDSSEWLGLEIHSTEGGGEADSEGMVEFTAVYKVKDHEYRHHEHATFHRVDGAWRFYDGKVDPGNARAWDITEGTAKAGDTITVRMVGRGGFSFRFTKK